jgi:hypothetical protein
MGEKIRRIFEMDRCMLATFVWWTPGGHVSKWNKMKLPMLATFSLFPSICKLTMSTATYKLMHNLRIKNSKYLSWGDY